MLLDGECVSDGTPECPTSQTFTGQECIHNGAPVCAAGYKLVGDQCLDTKPTGCPPGYADQSGICVSTEKPICSPPPPARNHIRRQRLRIDQGPRMPTRPQVQRAEGQKLNTERKEYELEGGPKCPAGQTYNGEHCILASTDCLEYEFCPAQSPALPKPPSALGMTANPSLSADSLKKRQPSRSVMEPVSGPKLVLSRASDFWKT
ncbi:hypothetical protein N7489_005000 [Penicillium chrysogenum]|uniref:Oocyst wall protein n=1 Tax=Penicillium chrysogenum TaxID=5076 RepID=A0ABQ8WDS6_PENCH|nr:uncharacterized protein N7489_005000 [Penicillium chrysogenum]KAJ5244904.1 hypothetical protein N7489_005000 [Penicillium chrysogenum]KAJ5264709.1 hypothetical protein N7505_007502 [Penicillium chrysogenum]